MYQKKKSQGKLEQKLELRQIGLRKLQKVVFLLSTVCKILFLEDTLPRKPYWQGSRGRGQGAGAVHKWALSPTSPVQDPSLTWRHLLLLILRFFQLGFQCWGPYIPMKCQLPITVAEQLPGV